MEWKVHSFKLFIPSYIALTSSNCTSIGEVGLYDCQVYVAGNDDSKLEDKHYPRNSLKTNSNSSVVL